MKKVLVVGGGIGGLSAALALRKAGIEVDLVEINQQWTVYHVGIVVQGNALRAMAALGVAEKCVAAGFFHLAVYLFGKHWPYKHVSGFHYILNIIE